MASLGAIAGALALALVLLIVVPPTKRRIGAARASKRYGCAAPPRLPAKDPVFGIDTVRDSMRAAKENRRIKTIYSQYQKYGRTFESWPFGRRVVSTVDARNIQFILATEHEKFGVGPVRELAQVPMTGKGIITSDGEVWRHGRDMIRPTFTRSQINDPEMFDRHVGRFLALLPNNDDTVDLKELFDRLVSTSALLTHLILMLARQILDSSSEFIFGESMRSLLMNDCPIDSKTFLDSFSYAQKGVGARVLMGKMSFVLRDHKFWESCKLIRSYTQRHVDRALARREKNPDEDQRKYILVYEMAKETTDREALCSQLLNVFFAGRDTPAVALSNVFFCLARHPEAWQKIREEVAGVTKEDLTFERLKSFRYVQHSINEGRPGTSPTFHVAANRSQLSGSTHLFRISHAAVLLRLCCRTEVDRMARLPFSSSPATQSQ